MRIYSYFLWLMSQQIVSHLPRVTRGTWMNELLLAICIHIVIDALIFMIDACNTQKHVHPGATVSDYYNKWGRTYLDHTTILVLLYLIVFSNLTLCIFYIHHICNLLCKLFLYIYVFHIVHSSTKISTISQIWCTAWNFKCMI